MHFQVNIELEHAQYHRIGKSVLHWEWSMGVAIIIVRFVVLVAIALKMQNEDDLIKPTDHREASIFLRRHRQTAFIPFAHARGVIIVNDAFILICMDPSLI